MADPTEDAPAWAAALPGADAAPVPASADDSDTPAWAGALKTPRHAVAPSPVITHHAAAGPPTRFQQSTAPSPEPEMSWADTGKQALANALPSLGGAGKAMLDTVLHPIKTATALGDLGKGAVSQAAGAVGMQQDPKTKAQSEKLIAALEDHYKATYGSVKGFKKALATDPASVAMDVSSVIPGVGAAADAAGLAKTASVIGKIGSAVDPVANAVRVASLPAKVIAPIARQASAITTGVPASALKLATKVGAHTDPAVRAAYTKFVTGQGDASEFQRAAQGAVTGIKKDMSDAYLAQKGPMANKPVDLTNTQAALAEATQKAQMGSTVGPVQDAAMKAIKDAQAMADNVASDPARATLEHVDALKQQMWNLKDFHKEVADNYLNGIYHGVKADLVGADPEYASLMEKYQNASQNINDLTKTLVGGKNAAASSTFLKSLRAMKTGTGGNLLDQLIAKDPTIMGMLAGQALHPWHRNGISLGEAALGAGAVLHNPAMAPISIPATLAASSPRIAGAVNYGAGAASRLLKTNPAYGKGAYYAGRAEEEGNGDEPNPPSDLMNSAKAAISGIESGGNYDVVGPVVHHNGVNDRAIGKYQVMESNIPRWTEATLGKRMTPEEFRADPGAQEKVFEGVFGHYLQKFGNMKDAASAWHSGVPLDQAVSEGRHDVNMSTADYVKSATGRMGRAAGGKTENKMTHQQLVERLMKLARAAKRGENAKTETLLNVPDAVVVKALEVAQAAI